jgi:hypothetical protein
MAASISPGTLLAVDQTAGVQQRGMLFSVDQGTGQRTVVSDFNDASQGVTGVDPDAVGAASSLLGLVSGTVLVTDGSGGSNERGALYSIDPSTGQRTVLSDFGNSTQGPLGEYPVGVLDVPAGLLAWSGVLVVDAYAGTNGQGALFSVDGNGNRSLIIDFGDNNGVQGAYPDALALYDSGLLGLGHTILLLDGSAGTHQHGALFSIDPVNKTRALVSDFGDSSEGWVDPSALSTPISITTSPATLLSAGKVYVLVEEAGTNGKGALVQVDPTTGERTLVSDLGDASKGPVDGNPTGVAWLARANRLTVSDSETGTSDDGGVLLVNPADGTRTMLSDFGNAAQGIAGSEPSGLFVTQ